MADTLLDRLALLEDTVRRAAATLDRLREENETLRREMARMAADRKQTAAQIDAILSDINKLDL
jgi:phage shock protein A